MSQQNHKSNSGLKNYFYIDVKRDTIYKDIK